MAANPDRLEKMRRSKLRKVAALRRKLNDDAPPAPAPVQPPPRERSPR
ncbi:MAG: hypothetical protein P8080_07715 [Gammaproteobacteria bacterium]